MTRLSASRVTTTLPIVLAAASCVPPPAAQLRPPPPVVLAEAAMPGFSFMELSPPVSSLTPLTPAEEAKWNKAGSLFAAPSATPAAAFAFDGEAEDRRRALECLTAAVYYEARSEGAGGQKAVAQVVLNRVRHPAFPASVCGVVYQGSGRRTGCQFSFTCDGSLGRRREPHAWGQAREIAAAALDGTVYAPVGNATHYHTRSVLPYWARSLTHSATVGAHIFYRWRGGAGSARAFSQDYAGEAAPQPRPSEAAAVPPSPSVRSIERVSAEDGTIRIHRGEAPPPRVELGVRVHSGTPPAES